MYKILMSTPRLTIRAVGAICLLAICFFGLLAPTLWDMSIDDSLRVLANAILSVGSIGWFILAILQIFVVATGLLPASLFGIVAGAIYGLLSGFSLAVISTLIGAIFTFWLSRSMLRPYLVLVLRNHPKIQNFDRMIIEDGWRLVFLLRLSPLMPFAVTS